MTVEALGLYRSRLTPTGVLAFHVSNRFLDLPAVPAKAGLALEPPMLAYLGDGRAIDERDKLDGVQPSVWLLLARDPANFSGKPQTYFTRYEPPADAPVWRDDFSALWPIVRWREEN